MLKGGTYCRLNSTGCLGTIDGSVMDQGYQVYIFKPDPRLCTFVACQVGETGVEICPRPSDDEVWKMLSQEEEKKPKWLNRSR